ncbi:tetratricopeptide repeat protein [Roseibium sp. SCPC15]|uniref:tetratricopeptide repeat protein n=1 Tax=Roseibium sp. SCP15 TaxID=3141376 RepID=UPI00333ABF6B
MTAAARKAYEEAISLEGSGDLDNALVCYLKALELAPQDTEIAYRTATALLQAGYLEEAQSQLRRVVFAEPENLKARASLGNCQLLMNDFENAQQNFDEVLSASADNLNALYGLASVFMKLGEPKKAAVPAKRLFELLPESPEVLTLFADTHANGTQISAAVAAYRRALKIQPEFTPALLGLANLLLLRKRFDEVIELTIRANQLAPTDPWSLEILADALSGKGQLEDAFEAADAALKLNGRSQSNLVRLSILSRKLGKHDAALDYALRAHDLNQAASEPLNALGAALAALKFSPQARAVLTGLSSGRELDPEIRKLAEDLIASNPNKSSAPTVQVNQPIGENVTAGSSVQEQARTSDPVGSEPNSDQTETLVGQPSLPKEKPLGGQLADDEPLPNVLGLQRRDRT